jgi:uncharacterized protein involved in outer membrane biogenesis
LLDAPNEARAMGLAGRQMAVADFSQASLWGAQLQLYWAMLAGAMLAGEADDATLARGSSPTAVE